MNKNNIVARKLCFQENPTINYIEHKAHSTQTRFQLFVSPYCIKAHCPIISEHTEIQTVPVKFWVN